MEKTMVKTIEIVSLSSGIIGESFIKFEMDLGLKRLSDLGIKVKFSNHALMGFDYIKDHPEDRARDLLDAFCDDEVDMILCAIGGNDTYRLTPYLFDNDELKKNISKKIFLGFSDTTNNHFMFKKLGLNTFYGQAFLPDVCELEGDMFPYSKKYFEELIKTGSISCIKPSDIWYDSRTDFSPNAVGIPMHKNENEGFVLLKGKSNFEGEIFGGCIDSIFDMLSKDSECNKIYEKYDIFPDNDFWNGKILLLETSEEKMNPQKYEESIRLLKDKGVFARINGLLIGQSVDRSYEKEYWEILKEELHEYDFPILCNINIGHSTPRCIIPFGIKAYVDANNQEICFEK